MARLIACLFFMPSDLVLITAIFAIFTLVREVLSYKQVTKLQELIKSNDINEYYQAKKEPKVEKQENEMTQEKNEISIDDPRFDITKATKAMINDQEVPIELHG